MTGTRQDDSAAPAAPGVVATYDRIRNEIIFEHGLLGQEL
jgi:hypothetical protein